MALFMVSSVEAQGRAFQIPGFSEVSWTSLLLWGATKVGLGLKGL